MDEMLKEIKELAQEIKIEQKNASTDIDILSTEYVLKQYIEDMRLYPATNFWLDENSEVRDGVTEYIPNCYNSFCNYTNASYAHNAAKIKKFHDLLMAFKWCYDKDYEPDFSTSQQCKYSVYYNTTDMAYEVNTYQSVLHPIVYFSNKEIAEKCAKWLNHIDPKGELLI